MGRPQDLRAGGFPGPACRLAVEDMRYAHAGAGHVAERRGNQHVARAAQCEDRRFGGVLPSVDRGTDTALSTPSRMVGMGSTPAIYIEKFAYN